VVGSKKFKSMFGNNSLMTTGGKMRIKMKESAGMVNKECKSMIFFGIGTATVSRNHSRGCTLNLISWNTSSRSKIQSIYDTRCMRRSYTGFVLFAMKAGFAEKKFTVTNRRR
jgi:hypothetical protein